MIVLMVILFSDGPPPHQINDLDDPTPEDTAPPRPKVDVSKYEEEGKKKCTLGMELVRKHVDTTSGRDPEILRFDLDAAYTQLTLGLAAYETAAKLSGKTYDLKKYRRGRDRAMTALCNNIENEARETAEKGLRIIRECKPLMSGRALNDEDHTKLREDLKEGKALIEKGMSLFERSNTISGHTFDTTSYGQARKLASMKLLEMKE